MATFKAARAFAGGFFISSILLLSGCATTPQLERLRAKPPALPESVELAAVSFFPQEAYQCGPAALATVLNWSGAKTTPEALAPQVYLPARQGSLQDELLGAARRAGRIPYVLKPEFEVLLAEVAAGHPVLVLQNLGLSWYPKWHYAVVVGYDLAQEQLVLRSGTRERRLTPFAVFERTWRRGQHWAVVTMAPEELPTTAEEFTYLRAIATLEQLNRWHDVGIAYEKALSRWPQSQLAQLGLGNSRYALGGVREAERIFRRITQEHPDSAPAFNNLAQTLADQRRWQEARRAARQAVALGGPLRAAYQNTLDEILRRSPKAAEN